MSDLRPFTTDGASGFISFFYEIIFKRPLPWEHLAVEHDRAYWQGGPLYLRKIADLKLEAELIQYYAETDVLLAKRIWHHITPDLVYLGVRLGGQFWIPFPSMRRVDGKWKLEWNGVRWGFG